jgi:hypothetical protein
MITIFIISVVAIMLMVENMVDSMIYAVVATIVNEITIERICNTRLFAGVARVFQTTSLVFCAAEVITLLS